MPNVGGVQYPYTPEGIAAAQQAQRPTHESQRSSPSWYGGGGSMFGNLTGGVSIPSLQDMLRFRALQEMMQQGQPTFRDVSHRPEQPTFSSVSHSPKYPPRGRPNIQTPQPTFASVSHRPQQGGNRAIGKQGPTFAPTSLNYNAISPANRIAGNIAAVMSGRPGPSPGTNPHLSQSGRISNPPGYQPNPYGPTGQLRPPRQPIQKRG